jgi:hypothetical protein
VTLEELADRMEILDVYARYVNFIDASDFAAVDDAVFLPDTRLDYRDGGGPQLTWTEARASGFFFDSESEPLFFHMSVNQVIKFDADRSRARVVSKTFNPWARTNDAGVPRTVHVHGRYHDELVRTDVGWRFASRRWEHAWSGAWVDGAFRLTGGMQEDMTL